MIPQEFQFRGVSVTFSMNICTQKSEFLFIYQNKFTTQQKPGGHLLFQVNLLQERHLNFCELFYQISEVVFSQAQISQGEHHQVHLHQGEEARRPRQPRTCQKDLQTPRNCIQGFIDLSEKILFSNMYFYIVQFEPFALCQRKQRLIATNSCFFFRWF